MHNPYSEDELIEQPAINLLTEMGWETLNCYSEFDQSDGSPLGRQTKSEVILTSRLHAVLERLNPTATQDVITKAIEELTRSRSLMSGVEANREIYTLLKDGVKVTTSDPIGEDENPEVLQVIDWENPEKNDFFAASQFSVTGEMYTKRPDLICFVNGIPLVLMEFKRIDVNLHDAYNDNLRDYKDTIRHLFWYNAFILLSNGTDSKVGSFTASWEHFAEWKRVHSEDESPKVSLETILQALCTPKRLLDVVENFILFMEAQGGLIKILAKNHQYLGVNNTIASLKQIEDNQGKLGVFWHTQGSGKSISMLFFAQKVLRKVPGNWTFVVVTDRKELDNQIYKTFASTSGVLTQQEVHAESVVHLRQLLAEDHRYIFTLIHKFQTQGSERHPVLSERSDIVVITDEAHRSQYHTLALNMRTALRVQKHWKRYTERLKSEITTQTGNERIFLEERIRYMEETDMAVVVSPGQNEIDDLRQKGVDITRHRARANTEDLDTKFKDSDDPFRIVFVCAMWITGFDVPSCSTIYLDKPQRNHTLMQTIARANRVFGDKNNGLIVDYIGVFRYLERALAIYATGADAEGNQKPIADKSKLVEKLREAIAEISEFCNSLGVDFANAETDDAWKNISQINDAMERILVNDETKKNYLQYATGVTKLYKAILPDRDVHEFIRICKLINVIAQKIKNLTTPADISGVMTGVESLLDQSIAPGGYLIQTPPDSYNSGQVDLSQIDFDQLSEQFRSEHKRIEAERLRGAINTKLTAMIRLNKNRMDYQAKFEQMIVEYNEGTIGIEDYFEQLFDLVGELNQEDQRANTEDLSEEELAVFDLLTRHEPHLTVPERDEVKTAVRRLLERLKQEKLVLDWRKWTQSKAEVKETVSNILDDELPQPYTHELFNQKSEAVYQHIYDSYYGEGKSIYTQN